MRGNRCRPRREEANQGGAAADGKDRCRPNPAAPMVPSHAFHDARSASHLHRGLDHHRARDGHARRTRPPAPPRGRSTRPRSPPGTRRACTAHQATGSASRSINAASIATGHATGMHSAPGHRLRPAGDHPGLDHHRARDGHARRTRAPAPPRGRSTRTQSPPGTRRACMPDACLNRGKRWQNVAFSGSI